MLIYIYFLELVIFISVTGCSSDYRKVCKLFHENAKMLLTFFFLFSNQIKSAMLKSNQQGFFHKVRWKCTNLHRNCRVQKRFHPIAPFYYHTACETIGTKLTLGELILISFDESYSHYVGKVFTNINYDLFSHTIIFTI